MSARRTPSTTSLSKYAKGQAGEDIINRSLDFCNAFWGLADGGFDVLLTRMRGACRTTEELRGFWKERAVIEEEYAKRLSKLSKQVLGRDEIGELRNSIETLRLETDRQATAHANLAQQMRKELEHPVMELLSRQAHFKKVSQATIEKSFKAKQTQEAYVKKARQKYEDDCVRINSYTAQSTLVQGKDLEKVQFKLEKAKQTVQTNEREFSQFARALADTTSRWEKEWKMFCDSCQDLEEERIEFMKDNMWSYANAVSTVCVADDESCEKLRVALEQVELDKDMENFVRDYNTGAQIPDPPGFVDYNTLEAGQSPSGATWRTANFARSTNRIVGLPLRQPPPEEEPSSPGNAGIGAGGGRSRDGENGTASRPNSATAIKSTTSANGVTAGPQIVSPTPSNGPPSNLQGPPAQAPTPLHSQAGPSQSSGMPQALPGLAKGTSTFRAPQTQDPHAEVIDPRAETMLKVGTHAYPVNLGEDPQSGGSTDTGRAVSSNVGEQDDPLARQAAELRSAAGTVRKGHNRAGNGAAPARRAAADAFSPPGGAGPSPPAPVASGSKSSVQNETIPSGSAPGTSQGGVSYHAQAEAVVGGPPPVVPRPASPKPPTASFMIPPENRPKSPIPVEEVVSMYQQKLPGERRLSVNRQLSISRGREAERGAGESSAQSQPRSVSPAREGHVGIGAHGGSRSTSPQPTSTPPVVAHLPPAPQQQGITYHAPPAQQGQVRATSPLGIALDETGNVAHDSLAERMYSQQQEQQRRASFYGQVPPQPPPPPQAPPQQQYPSFPSHGGGYTQPPQPRQYPQQPPPPLQQPPPQPHQVPGQSVSALYSPHTPQNQQRQATLYSPYGPAQGSVGKQGPANAALGHQQFPSPQHQPQPQRGYGYSEQPQQRPAYGGFTQHNQQSSNGYQHPYRAAADYNVSQGYRQQQEYRAPSPAHVHRPPSPAVQPKPPTGQFTDDGEGVLFYVKALYDYQATIDEEFDFQAGDVIAVTATPEDGWWSGVLLDEVRRIPGKTIFPSNFVSLF